MSYYMHYAKKEPKTNTKMTQKYPIGIYYYYYGTLRTSYLV